MNAPVNIPSLFPRISAKDTVRITGRFGDTDAMENVCSKVVCKTKEKIIKMIMVILRFTIALPLLCCFRFLSVSVYPFPQSSQFHFGTVP